MAGCALLIAAAIAIGHKAKLAPGDWGTWTGGIGTIGTLCFAIWIARAGERRARTEQMDLARVMAAEFWLVIPSLQDEIDFVERSMTTAYEDGYMDSIPVCQRTLATFTPWNSEKLARMTCLPNSAAAKLAMAATEIAICAKQLQNLIDDFTTLNEQDINSELLDVRESMRCIAGYLRDGFEQCDAVLATRVV